MKVQFSDITHRKFKYILDFQKMQGFNPRGSMVSDLQMHLIMSIGTSDEEAHILDFSSFLHFIKRY